MTTTNTATTRSYRAIAATHLLYARRTWLCWSDVHSLLVGCGARAKTVAGRARLSLMIREAAFQASEVAS